MKMSKTYIKGNMEKQKYHKLKKYKKLAFLKTD